MVKYDLLTKINLTLNRDGGVLASVPTAQEVVL
jgi:glycerol-3-phosphate acyltransferase PlsX